MKRALLGISVAFVVAIVAARYTYYVTTAPGDHPVSEPWAQNKMEFVAWNDDRWTAWVHDGSFEQSPLDTDNWSRHSKASIAFQGWDGEAWQAKIEGDMFLLAHRGNWQSTVDRTDAIRYRDWAGNNQIRTVEELNR